MVISVSVTVNLNHTAPTAIPPQIYDRIYAYILASIRCRQRWLAVAQLCKPRAVPRLGDRVDT